MPGIRIGFEYKVIRGDYNSRFDKVIKYIKEII